MFLKIPIHTFTQGLQPGAFLIGDFHNKTRCGYSKNIRSTRNHFHVQETTFEKETKQKFSCHIYIKNKLLVMPLAIKTKQKNKVQGSLDTLRL